MTGSELRDLFVSPEFRQGLEEMSCYLASIVQERPIVHLLAKCLWRQGYKRLKLEDKWYESAAQGLKRRRRAADLSVNGKRIEFKCDYDWQEKVLEAELRKSGGDLKRIPELLRRKEINKNRGVMARIYEDVWDKHPDILVWIIFSRDLGKIGKEDLGGICTARAQVKYNNRRRPYKPDCSCLPVFDDPFFDRLQAIRRFSLLKEAIQTTGDFPSTYHFRICDFAEDGTLPSSRPNKP